MVTSPRRNTPLVSVKPSSASPPSSRSRRSSSSPLRGTITPRLRLKVSVSLLVISDSRCPSVATMRTPPSVDSMYTPLRLCRVSSAEMANCVFSIISRRSLELIGVSLSLPVRGNGG